MKSTLPERIQAAAEPLTGSATDYDSLLQRVGDARFVRAVRGFAEQHVLQML